MRIHRLFYACFVSIWLIFTMASCQESLNEIETTSTGNEKAERNYIAIDLGEIDNLTRRFFPETRVNRIYVKLISVPLSEIVSSIQYEDRTVRLSLLPVKTHQGKVLSGGDVLLNIESAYKEDIAHFSANIIESNFESLDVSITFDREIDFEEEFFSLPVYPVTYLNGEDFDSLGEYRVTIMDLSAQRIELSSENSESIVMTHSDFEAAKTAFDAGDLDVLYLPHAGSAKLWADTVKGELVKISSHRVYMLGFGAAVPMEHRVMLYLNMANQDFINNYMGGFGEMTTFPAHSTKKYEFESDQTDPTVISYICFADSEWSYQFYRHLDGVLSSKNIYLNPIFTDFMTMMHMVQAEDAEYVYAFAWVTDSKTPLSELLGDWVVYGDVTESGELQSEPDAEPDSAAKNNIGMELDDAAEERYFSVLPAIPIASPYDYYLIRSDRFKHIIE